MKDMRTSERKLKHREEVRASILEAAEEIVLKEGWEALSIRKIAEAIDYSVPVIYNYFINKEALLREFVKQGFGMLNAILLKTLDLSEDPQAQLKSIGYAYLKFSSDNREYYRLMYGLGIPTCEAMNEIPELQTFMEIVTEPINNLIEHHPEKQMKVRVKFKSFWSTLHGIVSIDIMEISGKSSIDQKVLEDFFDSFFARIKN